MNAQKLSEVVDLQKGKKPEISLNSEGNLPYLTAKYIRGEADPEYGIPGSKGSLVVKPEDYLIIMDGSNSGEVFNGLNGILASTMGKLILKKEINMKYLGYFLDSNKDLFSQTKTGSAIPHLSKDVFFNLKIPTPPLQEQEKIVERLDEFFISIGNYNLLIDENIKLLKRLFISILDNEFGPYKQNGSELKKLSDISQIKGGKRVPKGYKLSDQKTNFPYIRVSDFDGNGGIDQSNIKYIDENIYKQIKKYSINSNDLFISIAGTIGKSGFVPNNLNGANLTENACKLVFNESTHNRYIYFFTKSNYFNKQVLDKTKTSSQPKLALKRLGEILVQVPTLEKQIELTNKLDVIEDNLNDLINKKNRLIFKTDLLSKAVLKKEFSHE